MEKTINIHANALEKILIEKGLTITKRNREWVISSGQGCSVTYQPETGMIHMPGTSVRYNRQILRGSPEKIAGVIEGLLKSGADKTA